MLAYKRGLFAALQAGKMKTASQVFDHLGQGLP
jgi:hypothetical protein